MKTKILKNSQSNDLGASLMITNCYACHSPEIEHKNRIAPPMAGIKKHYLDEFSSKDAFVNAIIEFAAKPSEDATLFPAKERVKNKCNSFRFF